ncbi:hypothetical protein [Vibrio phage XZ1]|uniref:Uncharacterized protein n=1 Tax=Vibrio phage ValKK3 TaxID=1610855 RepID=A0A0D4DAS4_9CAUD|nr:hypothetical protein AVU32_gp208 [Vibrio phage ValKK3]AJT61049.1 hypothetical protein [Vibrio phage ValKK3]ALP47684.1 hypothetical protein phiST2_0299 [Vibrio phage phi-ST2]UOL51436.1 hypothetical protein [Vibrio phage XZ1]
MIQILLATLGVILVFVSATPLVYVVNKIIEDEFDSMIASVTALLVAVAVFCFTFMFIAFTGAEYM